MIRKDVVSKFKKTHHESVRPNFLEKVNYFNIEIDAAK